MTERTNWAMKNWPGNDDANERVSKADAGRLGGGDHGGHDGGTCPLCDSGYDRTLAQHIEGGCSGGGR